MILGIEREGFVRTSYRVRGEMTLKQAREGVLFVQERCERGQEGFRNNLGSLGGGMDSIGLYCSRHIDHVSIDHRHERGAMRGGQVAENLVEGVNIVRAIV